MTKKTDDFFEKTTSQMFFPAFLKGFIRARHLVSADANTCIYFKSNEKHLKINNTILKKRNTQDRMFFFCVSNS